MAHVMYTICALMMVSILSLSIANTQLSADESKYGTEAVMSGTAIANSIIDEMMTKNFDEKAVSGITDPNKFSEPNKLKSDAGEDATNSQTFDDIDDYNDYSPVVATPTLGNYKITISVSYANMTPPYAATSSGRTFLKRADIRVYNRYIPNPVDSTLTVTRYFSYR